MKDPIAIFNKNIRSIAILFDLISPILLYLLLNSEKPILSAVVFIAVISVRIIYVVIS